MSFSNPIPGGSRGRTDQGIDISAAPGSRANDPVPGTSRLAGVIQNWYQGQPYYYFQVLSGPFKGKFWYVAEQFRSGLSIGQRVTQGQQVGTVAASGTGTEWGWATGSGATLAAATSGYTEGQTTPAGADFAARVRGSRGGAAAIWKPCILTWYDPALGGTNSSSGTADPHARTASGTPYNAGADTCAAPPAFPFGTKITFRYNGRTVVCTVNDRGGAIVGSHFDLSRHAAETLGVINAGMVSAEYSVGNALAGPGATGANRPGGDTSQTPSKGSQSLADYVALRDAPRTAPSRSQSFGWWYSQFQTAAAKVFGG